jgi:hypothetical protein
MGEVGNPADVKAEQQSSDIGEVAAQAVGAPRWVGKAVGTILAGILAAVVRTKTMST